MSILKRLLCTAIGALTIISATILIAHAEPGDIVGEIYSTDIAARISGNYVPSYNIGGRTVIVLEDIQNLYVGFTYKYNDIERLLTVYAGAGNKMNTQVERGEVGAILGDVYDTDIRVLLNGNYIQGYNIGGKTAVCIEDIGDLMDSPNGEYGYSKYAAKYTWDESKRTISLDFADHVPNEQLLASDVNQYVFYFNNNVITASYDEMNSYTSKFGLTNNRTFNNTPDFAAEQYVIKPLYMEIGGEKNEVGICYVTMDGFTYTNFTDYDGLVQKLKDYRRSRKKLYSYDEILNRFNDGENYALRTSLETEDYTMLLTKRLKDGQIDYVSVSKTGDFAILHTSPEYNRMEISQKGVNTVVVNVYPYVGMHGSTWMPMQFNLTLK